MNRFLIALLLVGLAMPSESWARGRSGSHHHHRTVVVGSAFFVGAPLWYSYHYPPYYYGPLYEATETPPAMYVEKFEGKPDATSGDIFCPSLGEYYPDVQECPNGWQRIIHPAGMAAEGGG